MAPEVISTTSYNEKCDVYSFGVMIWELVMRRVSGDYYNFNLSKIAYSTVKFLSTKEWKFWKF